MFEKAKPLQAAHGAAPDRDPRFGGMPARGAGGALRAVEWGELTARLNAARDLRLLLRTESQAPIEAVAASFGDAAASYFALLDHDEPDVNRDDLGHLNSPGAKLEPDRSSRPGRAEGTSSDAPRGDAREMK